MFFFFYYYFFKVSNIKFCAHTHKNKCTEPRSTATVYTGTNAASTLMKINMARHRFSPTPTERDTCIHLCCRLCFRICGVRVRVLLCVLGPCWGYSSEGVRTSLPLQCMEMYVHF